MSFFVELNKQKSVETQNYSIGKAITVIGLSVTIILRISLGARLTICWAIYSADTLMEFRLL